MPHWSRPSGRAHRSTIAILPPRRNLYLSNPPALTRSGEGGSLQPDGHARPPQGKLLRAFRDPTHPSCRLSSTTPRSRIQKRSSLPKAAPSIHVACSLEPLASFLFLLLLVLLPSKPIRELRLRRSAPYLRVLTRDAEPSTPGKARPPQAIAMPRARVFGSTPLFRPRPRHPEKRRSFGGQRAEDFSVRSCWTSVEESGA